MIRYRNHIYLKICEVTLNLFKNSNYNTYNNYCKGLKLSLKEGKLTKLEKQTILAIIEELELIFSLDSKEINEHIIDYFDSDRFKEFEQVVKNNNKLFPMSSIRE